LRAPTRWAAAVLVVGALLLSALTAPARGAFGPDGVEMLSLPSTPRGVIAYPGSRLLLLIGFTLEERQIVRLSADGSLDPTFGSGGITPIGWLDAAVQDDGRILVLGSTRTRGATEWDPTVTRLYPNGAVDTSFGDGGVIALDLGRSYDQANAIAVTPEGKIVIAGTSATRRDERTGSGDGRAVVLRLRPGGAPDRSFSGDGRRILTEEVDAYPTDVASAPRGAVIVKTHASLGEGLYKLRRNGSPDRSFGEGGRVFAPTSYALWGDSFFLGDDKVGVMPGGKVVIAGTALGLDNRFRLMAVRFRSDGNLDASFGKRGIARAEFPEASSFAGSFALQRNGRIVISATVGAPAGSDLRLGALAINGHGRLDHRFGDGGRISFDLGGRSLATGVVLQKPNLATIVGYAVLAPAQPQTVLARTPLLTPAVR